MKLTNPDCSSLYSWHGKDPNDNFLPLVYGHERLYYPLQNGLHKFTVKQDNHLISNPSGSVSTSKFIDVDFCCHGPFSIETPCGKFNTDCYISLGQPESVEENDNQNTTNFSIFPNPSSDHFSIQFSLSKKEMIQISLFNSLGRIVKTINSSGEAYPGDHNILVDVSDLPGGVYFLSFQTGNNLGQRTQKIVIQNDMKTFSY